MIKTFHEAPKVIFNQVQRMTDGDYALVNLFAEDLEYFKLFKSAVERGREVILDNGVFELGTAWDPEEFAYWIRQLQPTYYIVPDVLEDAQATIESFNRFRDKYSDLPGKVMGVAQGNSVEELVRCYQSIEPGCDKVCFSFDYSWLKAEGYSRRETNAAYGRVALMQYLDQNCIVNRNKPHHLLGVMLPQEMQAYYNEQRCSRMLWLDSVDTSNPVVHGLKGIRYGVNGLGAKESQKLYTMINSEVSQNQMEDIMWNIRVFRRFCNG